MMKKRKIAMCSSSSCLPSSSLVNEDIIIEKILLKLPVSSLLSVRCVSRYFHSLITSPSFIKKHLNHNSTQLNQKNLLLISSGFNHVLPVGVKKVHHRVFNFGNNTHDDPSYPQVVEMHCPFESTCIEASCNGLLFLHKLTSNITYPHTYIIWNPCTKEYKELPPLPRTTTTTTRWPQPWPPTPSTTSALSTRSIQQLGRPQPLKVCSSGFCGFGYDATNDEYKILYYENRFDFQFGSISEYKLYKLGTNTWTKVVTYNNYNLNMNNYIFGLYQNIGLFVNGALHWIMWPSSLQLFINRGGMNARGGMNGTIISFDMEKEEFRLIQKLPHPSTSAAAATSYGGLQVLQGCLCLSEFPSSLNTTYIWMLKDYGPRAYWTKLFTVVVPMEDYSLGIMHFKLLRLCENGEIVMARYHHYDEMENGRIVMKINLHNDMIVYDPVNNISRRVENLDEVIKKRWMYEMIYTESLVSLNSGTYMS